MKISFPLKEMMRVKRIESYGKWQAKDWWLAVWIYSVSFVAFAYVIITLKPPRSPIYSILCFVIPGFISNRLTWICKIKDKRKLVAWTCLVVYVVFYSLWQY